MKTLAQILMVSVVGLTVSSLTFADSAEIDKNAKRAAPKVDRVINAENARHNHVDTTIHSNNIKQTTNVNTRLNAPTIIENPRSSLTADNGSHNKVLNVPVKDNGNTADNGAQIGGVNSSTNTAAVQGVGNTGAHSGNSVGAGNSTSNIVKNSTITATDSTLFSNNGNVTSPVTPPQQ